MATANTPQVKGGGMTVSTAEQWLITSAAVVAGVYAFMRWKQKTDTPVGTFATSWGVIYFILALVTEASPQFGGTFSILVMVSDLLANTPALTDLVKQGQTSTPTAASSAASPAAANRSLGAPLSTTPTTGLSGSWIG